MSTLFITVEGIGWDIGYSLTVSALLTHAYKTHSTTRNLCTKYSHPSLLLVMMMLLLLLRCVMSLYSINDDKSRVPIATSIMKLQLWQGVAVTTQEE